MCTALVKEQIKGRFSNDGLPFPVGCWRIDMASDTLGKVLKGAALYVACQEPSQQCIKCVFLSELTGGAEGRSQENCCDNNSRGEGDRAPVEHHRSPLAPVLRAGRAW